MPEREGGEGYSREAYDEAEAEVTEAKGKISPEASTDELRGAVEQKARAEEKRAGLHEMAWDEALELNKQYDDLWGQKEQAEKALADFRREKFGMGEGKEAVEAEKKEPTMEEQAAIYAEIFGVDAAKIIEAAQGLQAEMSEDERKELTMLVYGPKGETADKAWARVKAENPTYKYIDPAKIKTKGETDKAFVAFAKFSQEADDDSLGENARSGEDWEKTDQKYLSPKQRMLAGEMYRRSEGKQLDEKNATMCPGSRSGYGDVPYVHFHPDDRKVNLSDVDPGYRTPNLGVRRVVSRELES